LGVAFFDKRKVLERVHFFLIKNEPVNSYLINFCFFLKQLLLALCIKQNLKMRIIQANIDHLEEVVALFDAYRVWYRKESDKYSAKEFLTERISNKDSVIYVCESEEGKLIGFTQLYPIFSSTRMKRMWLLNDLFVDPDHRGKGISKMLINKTKELSKLTDACGVLLETETTNDIGNRLYPQEGFQLEKNNFYFWANK